MRGWAAILALLLVAGRAAAAEVRIGFLQLADDPRYDRALAYARIELRPTGDAAEAARLGLADSQMLLDARGLTAVLDAARGADGPGLLAEAERMMSAGAAYIVLDLPAEEADRLATALRDRPVTLISATAQDDWLRRKCHPALLHTAASDRMIADAFVQYLVARDWKRVLVLVGPSGRDRQIADAFTAAAERLRLRIVERRDFVLSNDPRQRDRNNLQLLTAGTREYDAVYIADSDGEFGRYLPYQTSLPRPVIGSTGLTALEWHWALERYGAPQVNSRFEDASAGRRRMSWQDWTTWIAVRAILTAHAKARERTPEGILAFLRSERLRLDGSKGAPLSFRDWDGQLRQPILLATHNAVIALAPLDGFLHEENALDTLGTDRPEFACD
jgi:ABC transporter substrate binding protein (PQQ-dependent alcohol dehydrogenase system)